jgi:hypothetical protein
MRRGKHAPKHIRARTLEAPARNIGRLRTNSTCQVVTTRGLVCGTHAVFTGRSMRPTNPPTPRVECDLCHPHAQMMKDQFGYQVQLKQGEYALLA